MFKGDKNLVVGIFVSVAIAAFVGFVLWLTGRTGVEEMSRYSMMFHRDVSGLAVGGPVKFMGVNIGSVIAMTITRREGVEIRVDIEILETTPIDSGTYASLALQGITGVAVVNLASDPGSHEPLGKTPGMKYPVIPVREVGFAALLASAPEIMTKLDYLLGEAGEILGEENRMAIGGTLANIEAVTGSLAENRESIGAIPEDLRQTLADVQETVVQLQQLIGDVRPDLTSALYNINQSSQNLASMTSRLDRLVEENEAALRRFLDNGLGQAPELISGTKEAMRELEKLLQELQDDPSQLIHRPREHSLEIDP